MFRNHNCTQGMLPSDERFGIEPDGSEGKLVTITIDNNKNMEFFTPLKGNYNGLFDAVYDSVRENKFYPIMEEQIVWQLEILEAYFISISWRKNLRKTILFKI